MILGKVGVQIDDDFTVVDTTNVLVVGIASAAFTAHLFDSSGTEVSGSVIVTITELGYGHYRASFTPTSTGVWYLNVYHPTYFPWGKSGNIQVYNNDFDTLMTVLIRALGLMQENFFIDNTTYDPGGMTFGRIRTYSDAASVGSDLNVIATYQVTATYNGANIETYKVEKI